MLLPPLIAMYLPHLLVFLLLPLIASSYITFRGQDKDDFFRGIVRCQSDKFSDMALADLISVEDNNNATRIGYNFYYPKKALTCDNTLKDYIVVLCAQAEGKATCTGDLGSGSIKLGVHAKQDFEFWRSGPETCVDV